MQNDFITGSLGSPQAEAIIPNVRTKIEGYRKRGGQVVFTRDSHDNDYLKTQEGQILPVEHCIVETHGWEIHGGLDGETEHEKDGCFYVNKKTFGQLHWDDILEPYCHPFDEIEMIGVCTDVCVVSNALILKAYFPRVKITVDASCCAGVTEESHKAALLTMKMSQVNVINDN